MWSQAGQGENLPPMVPACLTFDVPGSKSEFGEDDFSSKHSQIYLIDLIWALRTPRFPRSSKVVVLQNDIYQAQQINGLWEAI